MTAWCQRVILGARDRKDNGSMLYRATILKRPKNYLLNEKGKISFSVHQEKLSIRKNRKLICLSHFYPLGGEE